MNYLRLFAPLALAVTLAACGPAAVTTAPDAGVVCDPDNGGLVLPGGFCALVIADSLGRVRHLAVRDNGDLYVTLAQSRGDDGGVAALRDTSGDGRMNVQERFFGVSMTGIGFRGDWLYLAPDTSVMRYRMTGDALVPGGPPETIVTGLPLRRQHASKPFAFDGAGGLYVNIGAPANACQEAPRTPGSPGLDPCPLLEAFAGIWHFDAERAGQRQADGTRYATGIRNAMALDWNAQVGGLYAVQHGRDQLSTLFPTLYSNEDNASLPAEELFRVDAGDDFGWPYCYYDQRKGLKVLNPEYGGDGSEVGRCADAEDPIAAFPGHWAPNDMVFYTGTQFPGRYRNGAFIAFHGSWNRAPMPQEGYRVVFVPFDGALADDEYDDFATGFPGTGDLASPGDATYRPTGLAVGPDGSLFIADSRRGRVWRVIHTG